MTAFRKSPTQRPTLPQASVPQRPGRVFPLGTLVAEIRARRKRRRSQSPMKPPLTLLVVDDDAGMRAWLAAFAAEQGWAVDCAGSGEQGLELLRERMPDLVTLDLSLPGIDGLATLHQLRALAPSVPVIVLSGVADTRVIALAMKHGATDFLRKPFEPQELEAAFAKAVGRREVPEQAGSVGIVFAGRSRKMRLVEEMIDRVADTDITVLIRGESGTGKELVARTLHARSSRARRAFVKVNCAALPAELLESELFGYERGAFTGASRRRLGKFELSHGGTIFLDEISEVHPGLQAKLLQVLQDGHFSRLGGEADISVDARVIAASNRNLETAVRECTFRADLFYRLNVVTIQLPPLRERKEEIPFLTDFFLERYAREYGRDPKPLPAELRDALSSYDWPGNIRELENLVKRVVVLDSVAPAIGELRARTANPSRPEPTALPITDLQRFLAGET
ncbi:MAG: sigma-54-dependent Fis family transcriptional regulator, partial [Deltaproteobacteria bacterium]|nr:sigma-54-dependent Fis family transcriptional regulator [Deltaproteobacteria bacterium]